MASVVSDNFKGTVVSLDQLPSNLLSKILQFCDDKSLQNMTNVGPRYRHLVNNLMEKLRIDQLPSELLLKIFSYLERSDLGRLARVNHRFRDLTYTDSLWMNEAKQALVTNSKERNVRFRTPRYLSAKDRVRVSQNWIRGTYLETKLLIQNERYMPKIHLDPDALWVSWGKCIWSHPRFVDGTVSRTASRVFKSHTDDVSRFVLKNGWLVSGGLDNSIFGWDSRTGEFMFANRYCHSSVISSVDVVGNDLIISGSRDCTLKIWSLMNSGVFPVHRQTINLGDRIWSLAADFAGTSVAVGSAGLGGVSPVHLLDLETGLPIVNLGKSLKRGAGMLDISWQTETTFLSCGYDTCTRLWDTRTGLCVRTWEEPHDEAIYCLATDNNMTLLCGTARHGLVRLWDMRHPQPVQMFFTKHAHARQSSPVYSIDFDQSNLYVSLDQCLNLLSFYGREKLGKFHRSY